MSTRQEKVSSLIKREVGSYIVKEKIEEIRGLLTITEVRVDPGLETARVYFSVIDQDPKEVLRVLKENIYEIQGHVNRKLVMKKVPRISFEIDERGEYAERINKILDEI